MLKLVGFWGRSLGTARPRAFYVRRGVFYMRTGEVYIQKVERPSLRGTFQEHFSFRRYCWLHG